MKNINVPLSDETHADLKFIQEYYSEKTGARFSQAQALRRLLYETANLIRNTGETYPNRNWEFENQENEMHQQYEKMNKKGESNEGK